MTQHTSHEHDIDHQEERSTDSQSATKTPNMDRGVVQDSPGTTELNTVNSQNSENGNLTEAETGRPDPEFGEGAEP